MTTNNTIGLTMSRNETLAEAIATHKLLERLPVGERAEFDTPLLVRIDDGVMIGTVGDFMAEGLSDGDVDPETDVVAETIGQALDQIAFWHNLA